MLRVARSLEDLSPRKAQRRTLGAALGLGTPPLDANLVAVDGLKEMIGALGLILEDGALGWIWEALVAPTPRTRHLHALRGVCENI